MKLICPKCGIHYGDNYTEYFNCWTSHINDKFLNNPTVISFHNDDINFFSVNMDRIEEKLEIICRRVKVFQGQIDMIAVDDKGRLCLIDVSGENIKRKKKQLQKHKEKLEYLGKHVFGLSSLPTIRILIPKRDKYIKEL